MTKPARNADAEELQQRRTIVGYGDRLGRALGVKYYLFVSENRSVYIVERALSTGAEGYVVKSDSGSELLPAVKVVLGGKWFISASLAAHFLVATSLRTTQTVLSWAVTLISGIP